MKKRLLYSFLYIAFLALVFLATYFIMEVKEPDYKKVSYAIEKGDTYDLLADKFKVKEDRRDWREKVKRLNGKSDSCLYEGEIIYVLAEENERN